MKNLKFRLNSKGRKYYDAVLINQNGKEYSCKVESEIELELNKVIELEVEDVSVKSKYGTKLQYKVVTQQAKQEKLILKSEYDAYLVEEMRKLGGHFDKEEKVWLVNPCFEKEVEELDYYFNSEVKEYKITAKEVKEISEDYFNCVYIFDKWNGKFKKGIGVNNVDFSGSNKNPVVKFEEGGYLIVKMPKNKIEYLKEVKRINLNAFEIIELN